VGLSAIAGLDGANILDLARRERGAGRALNATVLYRALRTGLLDRGPAVELGLAKTVEGR